MYPRAFEYFAVGTVREASELLAHYADEARVLAGGQSLIPLMKLRLANPSHIIDIGNILGLDYVKKSMAPCTWVRWQPTPPCWNSPMSVKAGR